MRSPRFKSLALLLLGASLFACHPADDDPESLRARTAHELAGSLMSPYCPGRTLAECPSPDALVVREEIRDSLRAGESPDAIRARIEARFGNVVEGMPRDRVRLAIPILVLAAGALALVFVLRAVVRRPRATPAPIPAEVERELSRELDDVERE
jgi:cytochrome c-type biogenesis protein CcmH/NrfF